jgi:hypothetical protein
MGKLNFNGPHSAAGVRGGAFGWDTALQDGRSRVRFPICPSGRTMALELTQPLTEMSKVKYSL